MIHDVVDTSVASCYLQTQPVRYMESISEEEAMEFAKQHRYQFVVKLRKTVTVQTSFWQFCHVFDDPEDFLWTFRHQFGYSNLNAADIRDRAQKAIDDENRWGQRGVKEYQIMARYIIDYPNQNRPSVRNRSTRRMSFPDEQVSVITAMQRV